MNRPVSTRKVKHGVKIVDNVVLVPRPPHGWELCIADAEERIAELRRSIEAFKHNIRCGIPFPKSATQN